MKEGLVAEYCESSATRKEGNQVGPPELWWEPRYTGEHNEEPNPEWRGAHLLLLETCGMVGNICFILCAALEDHWDFQDGTLVREGELRVIGSINLSLVRVKPEEQAAEQRIARLR